MKKRENLNNDFLLTQKKLENAIEDESILTSDLYKVLKSNPELINSSELFRKACFKLNEEYINCFLNLNIDVNTIINSNFKDELINATWRLATKDNSNLVKRDVQISILVNQYKQIMDNIKKHIKNKKIKSRR